VERIDTQDLGDFSQAQFASQFLLENGDEQVHAHRDPDLSLHRVVRVAEKGFDPQMLFDPFEEQFDLPTATIQLPNGQRRQQKVVGQKDQPPLPRDIVKTDSPQRLGII